MIHIRPASMADCHAIADTHVACWWETYRGLMPDDVIAAKSVPDREAQWGRWLAGDHPDRHILVAEDGEVGIVGFVACGPRRDPGMAVAGEIYAIYLRRSHQGRGVGAALFLGAARLLLELGLTSAGLWVLGGNDRAAGFYRRMGGIPGPQEQEETHGATLLHESYLWPDLTLVPGVIRAEREPVQA